MMLRTDAPPLVIYHANCADGFCAAWVARRVLFDAEFVAAYYGDDPPNVKDRDVFILDFSYKRPVMERILAEARCVTVLDHHKTAQEELAGLGRGVIFDMNKSGARLAWEFFFPDTTSAHFLVDYVEDGDLWRHEYAMSREVNAAIRSYAFEFDVWDKLAQESLSQLMTDGRAIRRAQQVVIDTAVRNASEFELNGFKGRVVNSPHYISEIAGRLAEDRDFGACYFDRQDGLRQWSLRSTPSGIDVAKLAKTYDGGGHKHAAGFEERDIYGPWGNILSIGLSLARMR
jgi:oligoribonuclease NrnB/cAMP/cGMP phosphodiesterase (DHH superfamily)